MATLAERLLSVQAAIAAIESGAQSVTVDGEVMTRANLDTLYRQEERLERRISREGIRRRTVAEF